MKKFLFTLLALFMASTAFATNEYFYMDDIQVTKSFLAQTGSKARDADIPVKAHFEARVSAWQVDLTLPEGVTLRNAKAGSDMTLHTLDAVGNDKAIPVEVNAQTAVNRIIVANAIKGYYYPEGADPDDDPVTCGAAKWEAGEYEMMMIDSRALSRSRKTPSSSTPIPTRPRPMPWSRTCSSACRALKWAATARSRPTARR